MTDPRDAAQIRREHARDAGRQRRARAAATNGDVSRATAARAAQRARRPGSDADVPADAAVVQRRTEIRRAARAEHRRRAEGARGGER